VSDLAHEVVTGDVTVEVTRAEGGGGRTVFGVFPLDGQSELELTGIPCQGGYGTTCTVKVKTKNYRQYQFQQLIRENRVNKASEGPVRPSVKAGRVRDIDPPRLGDLRASPRTLVNGAQMIAFKKEDRDLVGRSGAALYDNLGSLRQAALLNIATKANDDSTDHCGRFLGALLVVRQDRFLCEVDARMPEFLNGSGRFITAPDGLHKPLPGYRMIDVSFKSRDSHANLQVTFMKHRNGGLAADVDIDEASGFRHGLEVIRNTFRGRTNTYLIRELLLLRDQQKLSLDPGYGFVFK
jgi:hypothetical protein